ncbi:MAG TPA: PAS domain S-box protein [Polyangia bacterium]|nr:PAS domain S-box protein [Polyangia bacterium]
MMAPRGPEDRFDVLVESVKDYAIFLLDSGGHIATWNAGARLIKGYTAEEVIGKHISIFYTPEALSLGKPQMLLDTALREGRVEDIGWRVRKDGTRFWADVVITPILDHGGERGFIKVTRDLTRQKEDEEKLRRSEESLAATLYSIGDAVLACDERGRVTRINPVAERLTGWPEREAVGRPLEEVFNIINEETRLPVSNPVAKVLREGVIVGLANHTALVAREGTERPIADSGAPIRDAEGVTRGAVLVFRDVSEERRAAETLRRTQEEVRRSEESLRATLYSIGDGVLATDERGRVTRVNPVAERLTGWQESEARGHPIEEVFHIVNEETRAEAVNPVARVLAEGVVVGLANHTALISRDGAERPIADSGAPIRDLSGKPSGAVLVFRDVTAERAAEEALRQSEEKLRLMIASVRDYAFYMLDPAGRVASWNPGAERIKGYRAEEVLGQSFSRFFTPEDIAQQKPARELNIAATEGHFAEEGWRVRKDGSRFWASVVVTPIHAPPNHLVGFVKITRDMTERRAAEDERLKSAQAAEAIRLRDEFLSIASHELKTPLTALQLQLLNIQDQAKGDGEKLERNMDRARRLAARLGQLVETLLDVSRIATGRLKLSVEPFDLGDAAREVVERLGDSAKAAASELSLRSDGPLQGRWDRLRIEQVLMNVISNAIKYAAGQPIQVSLAREPGSAVIEVRDRGPGVPEGELSRIFERFERAASARHYGGMGLGLYVARQIAEAHGGTIVASNLPQGGACFTIRLPVDRQTERNPA